MGSEPLGGCQMTRLRWRHVSGVVAIAVALVAVPVARAEASSGTHADVTDNWDNYTASAVAQGVGYQFTFDGDSLASGAQQRWGGIIANSLPYSYALTSDVKREGKASIFWPSYAPTAYKDALPLLVDTVPLVGTPVPPSVVNVATQVAVAAPKYPFLATTQGDNPGQYATIPRTRFPGGSFAGAAMSCVPGSTAIHCAATATNVVLGSPPGTAIAESAAFERALAVGRASLAHLLGGWGGAALSVPGAGTAGLSIDSASTSADAVLEADRVRSLSQAVMTNVDILGAISIGSIRASATAVTDGKTTDVVRTVDVGDSSIYGVPVSIGNQGVTLARNAAVKSSTYETANALLQKALSAAGITLRLFDNRRATMTNGASDEGEALYIGLKLPNPGVPNQYFYLNYWLGGTINTATGLPVAGMGSAAAGPQSSAGGTSSMAAVAPGSQNLPSPPAGSGAASSAGQQAPGAGGDWMTSSGPPALTPAGDPTLAPVARHPLEVVARTLPGLETIASSHSRHDGNRAAVIGMLGVWQALGLATLLTVGKMRMSRSG